MLAKIKEQYIPKNKVKKPKSAVFATPITFDFNNKVNNNTVANVNVIFIISFINLLFLWKLCF